LIKVLPRQQGECFRQLEKHWQDIKHEFDSQPNKVFLDPEDFSDSVRGLPEDFDDKIVKEITYTANGKHWAYSLEKEELQHSMTTHAVFNTEEIPIQDQCCYNDCGTEHRNWQSHRQRGRLEIPDVSGRRGWRSEWHVCDESRTKETGTDDLEIWRGVRVPTRLAITQWIQRNPGERTTLLIDFYKESLYTKEKFENITNTTRSVSRGWRI
jgi:hypothetical protein